MIYTNENFPFGLWYSSKNNDSSCSGKEIFITSSFEYAICNSMLEPGKEAGCIKKVFLRDEINLFFFFFFFFFYTIQNYINHNDA